MPNEEDEDLLCALEWALWYLTVHFNADDGLSADALNNATQWALHMGEGYSTSEL